MDKNRAVLVYCDRDSGLINTVEEAAEVAQLAMSDAQVDEVRVILRDDQASLAECLESIQGRLEGAISMAHDISQPGYAGKIHAAWLILRDVEKSARSL